MNKPFSQACENNKTPILNVLKTIFKDCTEVFEVGSGTGQHAVFFAEHLPHLTWQPSDQAEYLAGISQWLSEASLDNIKSPLALNVRDQPWPVETLEAVFSANTLHIMCWEDVEVFFERLGSNLIDDGIFCSYGPYNKQGEYTSESNARFDQWLAQQSSFSAIRDLEALVALAAQHQIELIKEIEMPANNFCLIWQKEA